MSLTFRQWYKELRTEQEYRDMDKQETAERAWNFSQQQERKRAIGHIRNYLEYPALIIEALWYIEHGNPIESSMTKEQKERK